MSSSFAVSAMVWVKSLSPIYTREQYHSNNWCSRQMHNKPRCPFLISNFDLFILDYDNIYKYDKMKYRDKISVSLKINTGNNKCLLLFVYIMCTVQNTTYAY